MAAAPAMDNERLDAELRARVEELRDSRQRLVEATLSERRRLERDLHDGAQQRLVSLSLQLGLVAQQLERGPDGGGPAAQLLDAARAEARAALDDLPSSRAASTPRYSPTAACSRRSSRSPSARRCPSTPACPTSGSPEPSRRPPTSSSSTPRATHAEVRVGREHGWALVEVRDDGVGGADPAAGTGLRGLADRLAALDGRLEVESAPGRGTSVRARIPCGA